MLCSCVEGKRLHLPNGIPSVARILNGLQQSLAAVRALQYTQMKQRCSLQIRELCPTGVGYTEVPLRVSGAEVLLHMSSAEVLLHMSSAEVPLHVSSALRFL